ncbi:DNA repair protein RecO [Candidatus Daviesbacteria bacterium]|nr:DNA repair protein RecO [Candidatus Daviesbacteria bacterium]
MRSFKTEGIILKRRNFGEADRILTVFTPSRGKISVLAKGVRRIRSRRAGNVELLNRAVMYLHQSKGLPILTEAQTLASFQKIKEDLTLSTYAYHILELVNKLTAENQENRRLYSDLVEVLGWLSKNPRQIFIRAFEAKILSNLGFTNFQLHTQDLSSNVRQLLRDLELSSWEKIEAIKVKEKEALELEHILRYYIERTIEGKLKSRQFLKDLYG